MHKFKLISPSLSIYSIHLSSLLSILARFIVLFTFFFIYFIFFLFVFGFNPQWLLSFSWGAFVVPFVLVSFLYGRLKVHVPYSVLSRSKNHTPMVLGLTAFRSFSLIKKDIGIF
jgi:hypothetical protein